MNDSYRDQSMDDFFSEKKKNIGISGVHENIPYSGLTTHIVEILVLSPGWFRIIKRVIGDYGGVEVIIGLLWGYKNQWC